MAEQPARIRTMGFCNRPGSPVLKSVHNRLQEMHTENGKIHRIIPKSQAICLLAHIDSPNCIWFKMVNNITEQMQLHKSAYLEPLNNLNEVKSYIYVMAPIEEGVYARARILHVQPVKYKETRFSFVFAHFIDEGYGAWMLEDCLAKMDPQLQWHPWQAFPVSLFKFDLPKNLESFERLNYWPEEINDELIKIMGEYEQFKIVPVQGKMTNDYCEYTRAEIYGLNSERDNERGQAESIGHRLAIEFQPLELLDRNMFHVNQQIISKRDGIKPLTVGDAILLLQQMPKWRRTFPNDFSTIREEIIPENEEEREGQLPPHWQKIAGKLPLVEDFTFNLLRTHYSTNEGKQVVCIEWDSLKSPYEFYAFPLKQTLPEENKNKEVLIEKNPIRRLYNLQSELALELNKFYGDPINRRKVDPNEVFTNLAVGPYFGIYETNDEIRDRNFRRIQILAMRNRRGPEWTSEFCRIRYLDVGGTEIVPFCCILRIHTDHCNKPPLCIQLSLQTIQPVKTKNWHLDEIRFFKSQIRVDIPAICKLRLLNPHNAVTDYNSLPQSWPGVYGVYELNMGNVHLEAKMVENGSAIYTEAVNRNGN
ncbi:unnamed protein product [Meloidogyne enterolobii]|uniref:Uncharacterized protein n=1 Tax=Meloidogyne enterolobii TaxID=390850 RepID=A0ACB0ZEG3_MELEN